MAQRTVEELNNMGPQGNTGFGQRYTGTGGRSFMSGIANLAQGVQQDIARSDLGPIALGPLNPGGLDGLKNQGDVYARRLGFNSVEDFMARTSTGGIASIDENGDLDWGTVGQWLDEGVGEISGRNAKRGALHQQEKDYQAAKAKQEALIEEENFLRLQENLIASKAAGRDRTRSYEPRSRRGGSDDRIGAGGLTTTLGEQRDFLGL